MEKGIPRQPRLLFTSTTVRLKTKTKTKTKAQGEMCSKMKIQSRQREVEKNHKEKTTKKQNQGQKDAKQHGPAMSRKKKGAGGGRARTSDEDDDDVCVYVPRLCADPRCGALAVEVAVVRACGASSSSLISSLPRRGAGRAGRRRQQQQHAPGCREALLATLIRKDELERPAPRHGEGGNDDADDDGRDFPHLASPSPRKASKMTPSLSTRLINADLPGPLASFSSPLFPCASWGTNKWERARACHGGGATRFGNREGEVARGFGTVFWIFDKSVGDGLWDIEEQEDSDTLDIGDEGGHHAGASKIVAGPGAKPGSKNRRKGEYIRRSTLASAESLAAGGLPLLLLYCSEHLGRQYPTMSDKELQRIREFWGSLGSSSCGSGGDSDDDEGQNHGVRRRGDKRHGTLQEWSWRLEAKQPEYMSSLVERGLAF